MIVHTTSGVASSTLAAGICFDLIFAILLIIFAWMALTHKFDRWVSRGEKKMSDILTKIEKIIGLGAKPKTGAAKMEKPNGAWKLRYYGQETGDSRLGIGWYVRYFDNKDDAYAFLKTKQVEYAATGTETIEYINRMPLGAVKTIMPKPMPIQPLTPVGPSPARTSTPAPIPVSTPAKTPVQPAAEKPVAMDPVKSVSTQTPAPAQAPSATTAPAPAPTTAGRAWKMVGKSVIGSIHVKDGMKNQDSIDWYPYRNGSEIEPPIVMAVSDGHGGSRYFRSDVGSMLATTSAISVLHAFYGENKNVTDPEALKAKAACLGERIVETWTWHVREHARRHYFTDEEILKIVREDGGRGYDALVADPVVVYGATLVAALITPECILYLRIGDGDALILGADKKTVRRAINGGKGMNSSETDSLVSPNAKDRFKVEVEKNDPAGALMILMSTDGYENSFPEESGFLNIAPDYYKMIADYGSKWPEKLGGTLEGILEQTTKRGSGDDITIGVLKRTEYIGIGGR